MDNWSNLIATLRSAISSTQASSKQGPHAHTPGLRPHNRVLVRQQRSVCMKRKEEHLPPQPQRCHRKEKVSSNKKPRLPSIQLQNREKEISQKNEQKYKKRSH